MKNLRYYAFWAIDKLRGGITKRFYTEIKNVYERRVDVRDYQANKLHSLLKYATENTSFYKQYDSKNLNSFPVITKQDIIKARDDFFSNEFVDMKDKLHTMSTSGSTGTPFTMYQNREKVIRNKVDHIYFYELGDFYVGDRYYFMRVWNEFNRKSKLGEIAQNMKMYDTSLVGKEGADIFKSTMSKDKRKKMLLGYASSFTALVDFIDNSKEQNVSSIFSISEELPKGTKEKLKTIFQCPVMSRYSNQENGLLAQQPKTGEDYFILNEGSYYFEFLKIDSNEPAEEGELARIIITDLYNKAIPLIRYNTGDMCTFKIVNDRIVIDKIHGRVVDLLKTSAGTRLSPHTINNGMWKYKSLAEWQFIQQDLYNYKFKMVYKDIEKKEEYEKSLTNELKQLFGNDINITFEVMDKIPLEKSGKRKYIISHV